jgi:hypothetical protein
MPGQLGNKGGGRKSLGQELALIDRYKALAPKAFEIVNQMLDGNKKDKLWAMDWLKTGLVKMIPQKIGGDPENPVVFIPIELTKKNGITPTTLSPNSSTSSTGLPQV